MTGITIRVIPIGQNILHSTILPFLTRLSLLGIFFWQVVGRKYHLQEAIHQEISARSTYVGAELPTSGITFQHVLQCTKVQICIELLHITRNISYVYLSSKQSCCWAWYHIEATLLLAIDYIAISIPNACCKSLLYR